MTREEETERAVDMATEALSADAEFADLPDIPRYYYEKVVGNMAHEINMLKEQLESAVSREVYEKRTQADEAIIDSYRSELAELKSKFGLADAVEVVRCKDCKNADTVGVFVDGVVYCNTYQTSRIKEGYCDKGERREESEVEKGGDVI